MKEARITMPLVGDFMTSEASERAHRLFSIRVAKRFGGYTATKGYGGWVDASGNLIEEAVTVYDIAATPDEAADADLVELAEWFGRELRQEAVYVRSFAGEVSIIDLSIQD